MRKFIFEIRPYQTEAVAQVLTEFENGRDSVLLESPVGSGKTVMGLLIIQKLQAQANGRLRVNWVASRRHILEQTQDLNDSFFHCDINMVSVFAANPPKADLVVLDELNIALHYGWLPLDDVLASLRSRKPELNVVVTGRYAPDALLEISDLISEIKAVRHPYEKGIPARPGIDF